MIAGRSNKFLVILVAVLLITNLGMLWYFTSNNEDTEKKEEKLSRNERQVAYMVKELGLDSVQKAEYIALRVRRDSALRPLNDNLREAKLRLMTYLKETNISDSMLAAVTAEIAARQQPIEMEFYRHFGRVRGICKPEQVAKYDSMLVRFVNKNTGKEEKK